MSRRSQMFQKTPVRSRVRDHARCSLGPVLLNFFYQGRTKTKILGPAVDDLEATGSSPGYCPHIMPQSIITTVQRRYLGRPLMGVESREGTSQCVFIIPVLKIMCFKSLYFCWLFHTLCYVS